MSLEQLADTMKGRPEIDDHAKERAAERARQPFHGGWLADVYPFWQAPMKTLSRTAGVSRVGHGINVTPDLGVTFGGPYAPIISEDVFAETLVGVTAKVSYVFGGDANDGQLLRVPSFSDNGNATLLNEHVKVWTGPVDRLLAAAEGDVDDASQLLARTLVEGIKARDARIEREAKEAAEAAAAEKARIEKAEKDEAERQERMKTAALEASKAAEEAAKAAPAEPVVDPNTVAHARNAGETTDEPAAELDNGPVTPAELDEARRTGAAPGAVAAARRKKPK